MKFTFDFRKIHKLISWWNTPGNKLTKLTNSSHGETHLETNSQNSQTHCKYPQEQTPPKTETHIYFWTSPRRNRENT